MDVSVVVPVLNEEENVETLYRRIADALDRDGRTYEILFVDDGSTDRTVSILRSLQAGDPKLRVVKLRRNYGQTPAMRAGIDHARGEAVVTLDGDLQNDPDDIPRLLDLLHGGYDLVTGWRQKRQDAWLHRKLPSLVANAMIAAVTGVRVRDNGCSLKAFRTEVIRKTPLYSELHRFIPAMVTAVGGRIAEVPVRHHARLHGTSKYGLSRTLKVLLDLVMVKMLIVFSERPLQWFALLSIPPAMLAILCTAWFAVQAYVIPVAKPTVIVQSLAMLFAYAAAQLLLLGFLGELIVRTGRRHGFRSSTHIRVL